VNDSTDSSHGSSSRRATQGIGRRAVARWLVLMGRKKDHRLPSRGEDRRPLYWLSAKLIVRVLSRTISPQFISFQAAAHLLSDRSPSAFRPQPICFQAAAHLLSGPRRAIFQCSTSAAERGHPYGMVSQHAAVPLLLHCSFLHVPRRFLCSTGFDAPWRTLVGRAGESPQLLRAADGISQAARVHVRCAPTAVTAPHPPLCDSSQGST